MAPSKNSFRSIRYGCLREPCPKLLRILAVIDTRADFGIHIEATRRQDTEKRLGQCFDFALRLAFSGARPQDRRQILIAFPLQKIP